MSLAVVVKVGWSKANDSLKFDVPFNFGGGGWWSCVSVAPVIFGAISHVGVQRMPLAAQKRTRTHEIKRKPRSE